MVNKTETIISLQSVIWILTEATNVIYVPRQKHRDPEVESSTPDPGVAGSNTVEGEILA